MKSSAKTPAEYMASLPEDRRRQLEVVRKLIKKHLNKGFEEMIQWGMISYAVSLKRFPEGYGEDPTVPLPYLAFGSQKNYMAIYVLGTYGEESVRDQLEADFKKAGKKLDMGKGCLRFKKLEDIDLPAIAKVVSSSTVEQWIELYTQARKKLKKNKKK